MPFDSFVVLAEMRTGSNLLESHLNQFDGVTCEGEVFNPHFISHHKTREFMGYDLARREADPLGLWAAIRARPGLNGFRFFHDHDPRVLDHVLADQRCAKIVLSRNMLDSYVSLRIAAATSQWKLGNVERKRSAQVEFDPVDFEAHVDARARFRQRLVRALQISGQSAFHIDYDDLNDVAVLNGLAAWLGAEARVERLPARLKRQNPEPLADKLLNPEAVADGIARLDPFELGRLPGMEPRRGAMLWAWRTAARAPLLYAPVLGGPDRAIAKWMAAADGVATSALGRDLTQQALGAWLDAHPRRIVFSVLPHPLVRAHAVFQRQVVQGERHAIRKFLARVHDVHLPEPAPGVSLEPGLHRAAFLAYLHFVRANLAGQTSIAVLAPWASQTANLQGIASACLPDRLLREESLEHDLEQIAGALGLTIPEASGRTCAAHAALSAILDPEIQAAARAAYAIDYRVLGFGDWVPPA